MRDCAEKAPIRINWLERTFRCPFCWMKGLTIRVFSAWTVKTISERRYNNMYREELVIEIIYITILREFFTVGATFICTIFGIVGKLIVVYIYSIVDEARLLSEAYREAEH